MSLAGRLVRPVARAWPQRTMQLRLVLKMIGWNLRRIRQALVADPGYAALEPPMTDKVPVNDIAMGLIARAMAEGRYDTAIEIGTFDGRRIAAAKRLFPSVAAHGLDVQPRFDPPFEAFGVSYRRFATDFLAEPRGRSLVVSIGTLTCVPPPDLPGVLDAIRRGGHDLLFMELTPGFRHEGSLKRSKHTWYHDYDSILPRHGFRLAGPGDVGRSGQYEISDFDMRYANLAVPQERPLP